MDAETVAEGMRAKAEEFRQSGGEIYQPEDPAAGRA
jgi:hypothetical protein